MKTQNITTSKSQTIRLAKQFAKTLQGGEVILLTGPLGSGKTTFTQGILLFFGISDVQSPTFVLKKNYIPILRAAPVKMIQHIDLYRLTTQRDFESIDLEFLGQPETITLIEWGEKIKHLLAIPFSLIEFHYATTNKRRIVFHQKGHASKRKAR